MSYFTESEDLNYRTVLNGLPVSKPESFSTSSKNESSKKGDCEEDDLNLEDFDDDEIFDVSNLDDEYEDSRNKDSRVVRGLVKDEVRISILLF